MNILFEGLEKLNKKFLLKESMSWQEIKDSLQASIDEGEDPLDEYTDAGDEIDELCAEVENSLGIEAEPSHRAGYSGLFFYNHGKTGFLDFRTFNEEVIDLALESDSVDEFKLKYEDYISNEIPYEDDEDFNESLKKHKHFYKEGFIRGNIIEVNEPRHHYEVEYTPEFLNLLNIADKQREEFMKYLEQNYQNHEWLGKFDDVLTDIFVSKYDYPKSVLDYDIEVNRGFPEDGMRAIRKRNDNPAKYWYEYFIDTRVTYIKFKKKLKKMLNDKGLLVEPKNKRLSPKNKIKQGVELAFPKCDKAVKELITSWYINEIGQGPDFSTPEEYAEYFKDDIRGMLDSAGLQSEFDLVYNSLTDNNYL